MKPKIRVMLEDDFYDVEHRQIITMGRCKYQGTVRIFYLGITKHE